MYKIEKDVPFIKEKAKREPMYPFANMTPGDSFFVKGDKKKIQSMRIQMYLFKKTSLLDFASRKMADGARVWCFNKEA